MELFIKEWLVDKTENYHDPITRRKFKTFSSMEKCQKMRSSRNKVVEIRAERNVFAQLVLLSMEHDIDLELALSFQLGPVPWALATADGSPVKSDKSKLLHNLEGTIVPSDQPAIQDSVYICDGNAIRQSQIKSSEVNVKKVIEAFLGFTNPFFVASKRAVLLIFWCAS